MIPAVKDTLTSEKSSDFKTCWVYRAEHNALLRSVGHQFLDGRWQGSEDDFHVYRVKEIPGLGSPQRCYGPEILVRPDAGTNPVTASWRLAVARYWDQSSYYGSAEDHKPEPVTDSDFTDYVLGLNAQGTSWIVRHRPGNPAVQLGVFAAELRDLPGYPIFLRARTKSFADLGDEYLNVVFGWGPFVSDLKSFYTFQRSYHDKLKKLIVNNGSDIRIGPKKEVDTQTEVICEGTIPYPWPILYDPAIGGSLDLQKFRVGGPFGLTDSELLQGTGTCHYKYEVITKTTTWNCGTFRYYTPDIGSSEWTAKATKALWGVNPTPAVIWNIWPWTWLIDWWTNAGDIMSNLSTNAVDNETLTNSFSCKTVDVEHRITVRSSWDEINNGTPGEFFYLFIPAGSAEAVYSRFEIDKLRHQASPFGFGIPSSAFTAKQWSILAALGVSRVR